MNLIARRSGGRMNLIARRSGGRNIVARPQALPEWQPEATVNAADVEIYYRQLNDDGSFAGAPNFIGSFAPGAEIRIPYNPLTDKKLLLYKVERGGDGTPRWTNLREAASAGVIIGRETEAPTVALIGAATNTLIELAVSGFTKFATHRKLRVSPNADMSGATETITDYTGQEMPGVVQITRDADPAAQTIYVRISHSSGGAFAAESPAEGFTFTDAGGGGGSTGGGGYHWKVDPIDY